jgi:hypothetical protein
VPVWYQYFTVGLPLYNSRGDRQNGLLLLRSSICKEYGSIPDANAFGLLPARAPVPTIYFHSAKIFHSQLLTHDVCNGVIDSKMPEKFGIGYKPVVSILVFSSMI